MPLPTLFAATTTEGLPAWQLLSSQNPGPAPGPAPTPTPTPGPTPAPTPAPVINLALAALNAMLDPKYAHERLNYVFDFRRLLEEGETLDTNVAPVISITSRSVASEDTSAMLVTDSAEFDPLQLVKCQIEAGTPGHSYYASCRCTTSRGRTGVTAEVNFRVYSVNGSRAIRIDE